MDPVIDPNISTFRPLDQKIGSNIRYNGNGYLPCNGFVPCQVRREGKGEGRKGMETNLTVLSARPTGPLAAGGETGGRHALPQLQGGGGRT